MPEPKFFEYIDADGQYRRLPCNPPEEEPPMPSIAASLLTLFRRSLFALLLLSACALAFTAAFRLRQARAELEETGEQLDKTKALLLRYEVALAQANANIELQNDRILRAGPYVEALQKKAADAEAAEKQVKMACGWHDV